MNSTKTLTKNQAYDIAKLAEPFLNSVLNPWDVDGAYPLKVSTIYTEIINDPAGFRDFVNGYVTEQDLTEKELEQGKEILSALDAATEEA